MKKALYGAAIAVALAVGVGVYVSTGSSPAPASTFVLLDGSKKTTDDLKGKVTLVNFWATSCVTCVGEMPKVIATYDKYKAKGYDTLAVAMSYDPPSYVINYAETRKLPFKVAIDNTGAVAKAWGDVQLTPTTYVVNKKGEIVKRYVGEPNFDELHRLIEKLLAEDYRTKDYRDDVNRMAKGHDRCAPGSRIGFSQLLFVGNLAEHLLTDKFTDAALAADLGTDRTATPIAARSDSEMIAMCIVMRAPAESAKLFHSEVMSDAEKAALTAIAPQLSGCVPKGTQFKTNRAGLRALLALAAYRVAVTSKEGATG